MTERRVAFEISTLMGMGGILSNAGVALETADSSGVSPKLIFSSDTYRPTNGIHDWLGEYFDLRVNNVDVTATVEVKNLPKTLTLPKNIAYRPDLVWAFLQISPRVITPVRKMAGGGRFLAIHFRGSDKYLEAPRAREEVVLERAEQEMARLRLDRIFIATDELGFFESAIKRFGDSAFFLEEGLFADDKHVPPHFRSEPGELKATQALQTMWLLSQADVLVRTQSLLSAWANSLSLDQTNIVIQ